MGRTYTFNAWDANVLKWMHPSFEVELGVKFTWKCAVTTSLASYIQTHAVHGTSFEHMHDYVSSSHHITCDTARLQYALAVDYWNLNAGMGAAKIGLDGEWGDFDDPDGWAGYVPGKEYFVAVFLQLSANAEEFHSRCVQMVDANIISGDASLKVPKCIRLHGGPVYKSHLYTCMNEHAQVVGLWMVDSDGHSELLPHFQGVQNRFKQHGWEGPHYAYGDNCCGGDRSLFMAAWPSLKGNPTEAEVRDQVAALQTAQLPNATLSKLKCNKEGCQVVRDRSTAEAVAASLLLDTSTREIGLDAEWRPFAGGSTVDVLQLGHERPDGSLQIYIFLLGGISPAATRTLPGSLLALLQSNDKLFVGNNIQADLTRLGNCFDCNLGKAKHDVRPSNIDDLSHLAHALDPVKWPTRSSKLGSLVPEYLKLQKPEEERCSAWDSLRLSPDQIKYAAIDVALHFRLHQTLKRLLLQASQTAIGFLPIGTMVELLVSSHVTPVGRGKVAERPTSFPVQHLAPSPHIVFVDCKLKDISALGALAPTQQTLTLVQLLSSVLEPSVFADMASYPDQVVCIPWPRVDIHIVHSDSHDDEHDDEQDTPAPTSSPTDTDPADLTAAFWYGDKEYPIQRVLLDAFHAMKRLGDTLLARHSLRSRFMSRLRDCLFAINDDDVRAAMQKLLQRGFTRAEIHDKYQTNYEYFVRLCRRHIPHPKALLEAFTKLIAAYTPTANSPARGYCTAKNSFLLEKKETQTQISNLKKHIATGCLSDPKCLSLYSQVGSRLFCHRGTNALEGFHRHLRAFFAGHSTSPRLAYALLMNFVYRWNYKQSIVRRGTLDVGHFDLPLMYRIHDVERKIGHDMNTTSLGVVGLPNVHDFADTKERFVYGRMVPLTPHLLDEELEVFMRHAAFEEDAGPPMSQDSPTFTDRTDTPVPLTEDDVRASAFAQCRAALARLKPTHCWLAVQHGLLRPALNPSHPTGAEYKLGNP